MGWAITRLVGKGIVDDRVVAEFVEGVQTRLAQVRLRIAESARKTGRDPASVTLVAVTKSLPQEQIPLLAGLGLDDFGENRPQELARRQPLLPRATWHMIGHLQRNKVPQVLDFATLIHSVDSLKLLQEIEIQSGKRGRTTRVLIQVNGSREPQKGGFDPDKPGEIVQAISGLRHVAVEGLMTMAADTDNPEEARPTFALVRELLNQIRPGCDLKRHRLDRLSMGMSGDFEQAIAEGATLLRLGSVLFAPEAL